MNRSPIGGGKRKLILRFQFFVVTLHFLSDGRILLPRPVRLCEVHQHPGMSQWVNQICRGQLCILIHPHGLIAISFNSPQS